MNSNGPTAQKLPRGTLVEWSFDGSTIRCQVGGGTVATTVAGNVGNIGNAVRLGSGATSGLSLDGRVAAVVVCDSYLSEGERLAMRGYLSSRYGVAS